MFWIVLSGLSQFFPLKKKTIFCDVDFFCSFLRKPPAQVEASTTTPGPARCLLIAQLNCFIFYLDNIQILKKMPKIDTLDALEEHKEHEDDYQTNSN